MHSEKLNLQDVPEQIQILFKKERGILEKYTFLFSEEEGYETNIARTLYEYKIKKYYEKINVAAHQGIHSCIREPIRNILYHGGIEKKETFNIMLCANKNYLVLGYFDGGNFFSREDIKKSYEQKTHHPNKDSWNKHPESKGLGTTYLYELSDLILIDTQTRTLWSGFEVKNNQHNLFSETHKI